MQHGIRLVFPRKFVPRTVHDIIQAGVILLRDDQQVAYEAMYIGESGPCVNLTHWFAAYIPPAEHEKVRVQLMIQCTAFAQRVNVPGLQFTFEGADLVARPIQEGGNPPSSPDTH